MRAWIGPGGFAREGHRLAAGGWRGIATAAWLAAAAACGEEEPIGPIPPDPVTNLQVATWRDSVSVTWVGSADAASYRVELRTSTDTVSQTLAASTDSVVFGGLQDEVTYDVQVFAINADGERGSDVVQVTPDHFPWDEYYPTSLHFTRMGKETWYAASNGGFQAQTGVPYADLYASCQGCHRPDQAVGTNGCESCHDTATPALGATVDATLSGVCGACHNRSVYEAVDHGYTEFHRDSLGFTCMDCHTLEDVHGDGHAYVSMFEDGAIDADCRNCHPTVAGNIYHSYHDGTVDCAMCHMQTVISCYNCHMEGALLAPPEKRARRRILNWMLMVNRDGKVSPANVITLEYQNGTFAAIAPYFSHTIIKNAVLDCGECHGSANVQDLDADSVLIVADFDSATTNVTPAQGIIPVPFNYQTALKFDFLKYDPASGTWSLLQENGPNVFQMLYATPLTDAQLTKLR